MRVDIQKKSKRTGTEKRVTNRHEKERVISQIILYPFRTAKMKRNHFIIIDSEKAIYKVFVS